MAVEIPVRPRIHSSSVFHIDTQFLEGSIICGPYPAAVKATELEIFQIADSAKASSSGDVISFVSNMIFKHR